MNRGTTFVWPEIWMQPNNWHLMLRNRGYSPPLYSKALTREPWNGADPATHRTLAFARQSREQYENKKSIG